MSNTITTLPNLIAGKFVAYVIRTRAKDTQDLYLKSIDLQTFKKGMDHAILFDSQEDAEAAIEAMNSRIEPSQRLRSRLLSRLWSAAHVTSVSGRIETRRVIECVSVS